MGQIEAVFRHGVFEPLEPIVDLRDGQQVILDISPLPDHLSPAEFLVRVRALQDRILKDRNGELLPDSTPDIAADRLRDV
jgi:predicted DNA-binding antitoxin AbrB/MazE fold protein